MNQDNFVSAGVYVFGTDENGDICILAGKRGSTAPSCPNMYNVPVGMREYGETPEENAIRECYEETGIDLSNFNLQLVGSDEWARGRVGANFAANIGSTSSVRIGNGDGENDRFIWIPLHSVNRYPWAYGMGRTVMNIWNTFGKMNENRLDRIINESIKKIIYGKIW